MSNIYSNYTIPESYRDSWDSTIIKGYSQSSAHLANYATILPSPTGEYVKMPMVGSTTVSRRKQRHEKKEWTEPKFDDRRVYPVMYAASLALSDDDFVLKGTLPLSLPMLHDMMAEASQVIPDRVLLGVVYDEKKGNCVIPTTSDFSPYLNKPAQDATVNTESHNGQVGGLLGYNYIGMSGMNNAIVPQQPWIGTSVASDSSAYDTLAEMQKLDLKKTNVIPYNYNRTSTPAQSGLTIEKLRAARMALQLRHGLNPGEEVCMAITPWQMDDLLSLEQLQNKDFGFQTLKTGEVNTFLGIRFLVTVDVPIVNIGGSANPKWVRSCPMWKKSTVAFGTWQDMKSEVVKLPDYYDSWVASIQFGYGAARRHEEGVICVHCDELDLGAITTAA